MCPEPLTFKKFHYLTNSKIKVFRKVLVSAFHTIAMVFKGIVELREVNPIK